MGLLRKSEAQGIKHMLFVLRTTSYSSSRSRLAVINGLVSECAISMLLQCRKSLFYEPGEEVRFLFLTLLLLSSVVLELGQKVRMGKGSFKLHHNQPQALMCDRIPERGALVALLYVKVYWRLGFTDGAISRNYHTCAARSTMASPTAHKRGCIP